MTIGQSLKSLSAYPIPTATVTDIAEGCGLAVDTLLTKELRKSRDFRRAQAKTYLYLAGAPNVSQGGQSYSFSEDDRDFFKDLAKDILDDLGEEADGIGNNFGYQGEDL